MEVLFVQPCGSPAPNVVSVGALGCMNAVTRGKLGLYQHEATDDVIARARVVVAPLHWYFPLAAVVGWATHVRRVNPTARIVLGGLTAALFARQLLARGAADFVLTGDSEQPLRLLIDAVLSGESYETLASVPNVWSTLGPPRARVQHDAQSFGALDHLTHDWFPSFSRFNRLVHDEFARERFEFDGFYPFVPLVRGCRHACEFCFGGHQAYVYDRAPLQRPATDVVRDVERLCAGGFRFVNFLNGIEHASDVLDGLPSRVPMAASAYFCDVPSPEVLDGLVGRFEQCLFFCTDPDDDTPFNRTQDARGNRAEALHAALARVADRNVRVVVSRIDRGVAGERRLARLLAERPLPHVEMRDNYEYMLPVPRGPSRRAAPSDEEFERFHSWSAELQAYFAAASLTHEHATLWSHWAPFRPFAAPPLALAPPLASMQEALRARYAERYVPGLPEVALACRAVPRPSSVRPGLHRMTAPTAAAEAIARCPLRLDGRHPFFELAPPPDGCDLSVSVDLGTLDPLGAVATSTLRVALPAEGGWTKLRLELAPNELLASATSGLRSWTTSAPLGADPGIDAIPMDAGARLLALYDGLAARLASEPALRGFRASYRPRCVRVAPLGSCGGPVLEVAPDTGARCFARTARFAVSYRAGRGGSAHGAEAGGGVPTAVDVALAALVRLVTELEAAGERD